MDAEIGFVQQNLNAFSQQLIASGIDARVIMIAAGPVACTELWPGGPCLGGEIGVCIDAPLGSGQCPADSNPPVYTHIDEEVGSTNVLDKFLSAYPAYKPSLRANSTKTFVSITDDDSSTAAAAFMAAVPALDPDPAMWASWSYSSIYCFTDCGDAANVGTVHRDLVAATNGVGGDLCLQDFAPVFDALAMQVVSSAKLTCEWDIPEVPGGKVFEPGKTNVKLLLEGTEELLGRATTAGDCADSDGWHYDSESAPTKVLVCPSTCARIQAANEAKVDILFGCDSVPIMVD